MAKKTVTLGAEITPEQREYLNKLSEDMDRSVSWIIRDAINKYSKKNSEVLEVA